MPHNTIAPDNTDRKYFVMTPHIVLALCRDAYDFTIWSIVKTIAGESGECRLSADDLAKLCGCSHGKVFDSRSYLIATGLLKGQCRQEPGQRRPVWHLSIPDLWPDNVAWRSEIGPNWNDYIAAVLKTREANRHPMTIEKGQSSPHDDYPSPHDDQSSPHDDSTRDASLELKKLSEQEQEGLNGQTPKEVWEIARHRLRTQMTRSTYETWVHNTVCIGFTDEAGSGPLLELQTENAYARDWLSLRLRPMIGRTLTAIIGRTAHVTFTAKPTSGTPTMGQ